MTGDHREAFADERRGYDPATETYHTHHDWNGSTTLCHTLSTALAALRGVDARSTPLMSPFGDIDALQSLFRTESETAGSPGDKVTFRREGWTVTVYRSGHITLSHRDACSQSR